MKNIRTLGVAAVAVYALLQAHSSWSADPAPQLQFKDIGPVTEWRAGAPNVVYVKDRKEQWFRADMVETCMTLNTASGVKFLTESDMEDPTIRVSRVVVDHHMCTVYKLAKVDGPPPAAAPTTAAAK